MDLEIRPSEVLFSQNDIKNCFSDGRQIGEVVDDIVLGRTSIHNIPKITVVQIDGRFWSIDNRRLWVFKQLEELGQCDKITVKVGTRMPRGRKNTQNGGMTIKIRGGKSPGGIFHSSLDSLSRTLQLLNI